MIVQGVGLCEMDVVIFIVDVVKYTGAPASRYIWSYRKLEKNMKTLKDTLQDLNSKRRDLENQLKWELSIFKIEKEEVKTWKERADVINGEVERIEEEVGKRHFFSRARLGKHVEEKILEVKEFLKRAESFSVLVVDRPPEIGMILPTQELVGQGTVIDKIWAHMMGEEVGVVGVCGVQGVGKTIIMKHLNNKLVREIRIRDDKFSKVIWVSSTHDSQEFNVMKFQKEIAADLLGTSNNNQELLPEESDKRAGKVMQMLEACQGSVVIILDDVPKVFSLIDAGISEPIARGKCKLVMTSRFKEVCESMGCQEVEVVEPLPKNDALALFLQRSRLKHLMAVPVIARIVEEVVGECGGMPPAILSLASEMKGVNDVREWKKKRSEKIRWRDQGESEGEAALLAFMRRYDKDGDGRLSKYEVREALKEMGSSYPGWRAVRGLRHADTNRDGFIDKNELRSFIRYVNKSYSELL